MDKFYPSLILKSHAIQDTNDIERQFASNIIRYVFRFARFYNVLLERKVYLLTYPTSFMCFAMWDFMNNATSQVIP